MNSPISVIIPLYNKEFYILETISSVLSNTVLPLEILIVDDGSTDNSSELIKTISSDLIRLISQSNAGVSVARNRGVLEAKGELIAFLDADDTYHPLYLQTIMECYYRFPNALAYATSYEYLIDGNSIAPQFAKELPDNGFCGLVRDFYLWNKKASFFFTSSVCLNRKKFIEKKLFFPAGEQAGEDIDVWLRVAEEGDIVFKRDVLVRYRCKLENSLSSSNNHSHILPCYLRLIDRLQSGLIAEKFHSSAKRLYANQLMLTARAYASKNNFFSAYTYLFKKYALNAGTFWLKTTFEVVSNHIIYFLKNMHY